VLTRADGKYDARAVARPDDGVLRQTEAELRKHGVAYETRRAYRMAPTGRARWERR